MKRDGAILAGGILFAALVAALGDLLWAAFGIRDTVLAGTIHGAAMLTAPGLVLGIRAGRPLVGLPLGTLAGIGGALGYYALVRATGPVPAILAAWGTLWVGFAVLDGLILRRGGRPVPVIAIRGAVAAVAGSLAFWLVLRTVWGAAPEGGRNYALQVGAWALAWAPGLLAIGLPSRRDKAPEPSVTPTEIDG